MNASAIDIRPKAIEKAAIKQIAVKNLIEHMANRLRQSTAVGDGGETGRAWRISGRGID
ncbi:MAG: hypothetical protein ACRERY_04260 [Pseudomonas sp.]